jgi:hypothetical protein
MDSKDIDKRPDDSSGVPGVGPERPDFARGLRTKPREDAAPDFARGERTTPRARDVAPDFARGERTQPRDPAIRPDFAHGERTRLGD